MGLFTARFRVGRLYLRLIVNVFIAVRLLLRREDVGYDHIRGGRDFHLASAVLYNRLLPQFGLYIHPVKSGERGGCLYHYK